MRHLLGAMRQEALKAMGERATMRLATVSSYDPNNYSAKVKIQPEGHLTGWLPVLSPWVGNGWGMFCPPSIGDLVEVTFQEGDINSGFVGLRLFNDGARPLPVPTGEFWLVHQAGAFVKLTNDGKLLVNSQVEIDATAPAIKITATGNVDVTAGGNANITATGNASITATGNATISAAAATVTATTSAAVTAPSITLGAAAQTLKSFLTDAFIALFNGHTHNDPQGGVSGVPNQTATAAHATTTVKGG